MLRRRAFSSLPILVAALTNNAVHSQQPKQQQPLQPLGSVLHLVFDQDKDQRVTIAEVNQQMAMLEMLLASGEGAEGEEYRRLLAMAKGAAPTLFELLDSNGDGALSKAELEYATKFEKSLSKDGGMRGLVRDVFGILDGDGDDRLSVEELLEGSRDGAVIGRMTVKFHALFPLRKTPEELEKFVKGVIASIGGNTLEKEDMAAYIAWLDDDGDGFVQRGEVGKYYNKAGKEFLKIAKSIKQMGPMMAMMGGMNAGGGNGGFKMDL